jgi:FKBP-type peptidyl-prolyl cis-trans isomerase FkpA
MRLGTLGIACLLLSTVACGGKSPTAPTDPSQNLNVPFSQTDLVVGTGRQAAASNRVTVIYTLWLYDGSKTDNKGKQLESGQLPPFVIGTGQVIRGWDQGVPGMMVGGKRRLVIPPSLGYGSTGSGPIPPNATIIFDIELLNVE